MLLEAVNVKKTYAPLNKPLEVLKGIDLRVDEGEVLSVVGPSGAGKSTLLHILGGLDRPSEGKVIFDTEDIYQLKDEALARVRNQKFGFIFQFYHLLPELTAFENVVLPLLVREGRGRIRDFEPQGKKLLDDVGLKERMTHKPQELSGGEQQRVAIARALINQPKILFCDEPTGNLDSGRGKEIIDLLLSLNKKNKQTLVFVTHDEAIAGKAHRVINIKDGLLTES